MGIPLWRSAEEKKAEEQKRQADALHKVNSKIRKHNDRPRARNSGRRRSNMNRVLDGGQRDVEALIQIDRITERVNRTHDRIDDVLQDHASQPTGSESRLRQSSTTNHEYRWSESPAPPPLRRTDPPLTNGDETIQANPDTRQPTDAERWAPTPPHETPQGSSDQNQDQVRAMMDVYHDFARGVRARFLPREDALSDQGRLRLPTPPLTDEANSQTGARSQPQAGVGPRSLTPRFAPAHRQVDPVPEPVRPAVRRRSRSPLRPSTSRGELDRARERDRLPPLRRMARNSVHRLSDEVRADWVATMPRSTRRTDGLGDRRRSFSPETSWDTLHRTITPDISQPTSASTSFTSVQQLPQSTSGASNRMHDPNPIIARPRSREVAESSIDNSESEPSSSESDSRSWRYQESSVSSDESEDSSVQMNINHSTSVPGYDRPDSGPASRYNYSMNEGTTDEPEPRSSRRLRPGASLEAQRNYLRSMVNELARRQDIPTSWWETAGLGRIATGPTDDQNQRPLAPAPPLPTSGRDRVRRGTAPGTRRFRRNSHDGGLELEAFADVNRESDRRAAAHIQALRPELFRR